MPSTWSIHLIRCVLSAARKADTKTFCCLVRGYANPVLFHKVISGVKLAGKLEIPENTSFVNAVIYACAKGGGFNGDEKSFQANEDKSCQRDSTTSFVMIDAYRKEGMNNKVYDLEQENQMMTADVSTIMTKQMLH
ncbi:unnamed protein product [Fraxinus pennsylvanica]|uniref:Uncharacterized protein n=1 Tax=Fraxinus pennsylvanica TaxID=56036 RepID=A0AAD2DVT1_9LAMI|nr:unnamed protein product [Fraxinus pennsylvanica]